MFDYVSCKYPLPIEGANALRFQTKDTDAQYLENYEIREDGTLWREVSEHANKRWVSVPFDGPLSFCSLWRDIEPHGWIEFVATFAAGKLTDLRLIKNKPPAE